MSRIAAILLATLQGYAPAFRPARTDERPPLRPVRILGHQAASSLPLPARVRWHAENVGQADVPVSLPLVSTRY